MHIDDYKKIRSERIKQLKEWRVIPHWIWVVIVIVGCVLVLKDSSSWWLKMIGLIFVSYSSLQLGSRIWRVDDFMDGYEKGLSHRIDKNSDSTNNELTNQQFEELKLLYSISASDIAFFKRQQWVVTNYALILYAVLITISTKLLSEPIACWEKKVLGIVAGVIAIGANIIIYQLEVSINIRRKRLEVVRNNFSDKFIEAWSALKKQKDYVYPILYGVLYFGLVTAWWILYRNY